MKLVRDRMGLNPRTGDKVRVCANPSEYRRLLREKLGEEFAEFLTETERSGRWHEVIEEAADLIEVIETVVLEATGQDPERIYEVKKQKKVHRGGFLAGIILENP